VPALVVREGQVMESRYDISQEMSVGRENAAITVQDGEVSRRHAVVRPVEGGIEIQDLGSTNGTWVNERRVNSPTVVRPGDVLRLGRTKFSVELDAAVAPPAAAAQAAPAQPGPARPAPAPPAPVQPAPAPAQPGLAAPFGQGVVQPPQATFPAPAQPVRRRRRAATRGAVAMFVTFGVIVATAVLLVLYFAFRGSV
jgi:predicted component of type VI protein secretion system